MKKLLHFIITALASGLMPLIAQPVITSQPTNQFAFAGGQTTFSVLATGVGPFTYQWLCNGTNLPLTNIITTVAGSAATSGPLGDGGPATNAIMLKPQGVTVDKMGNILIADSLSLIRRVDTNGIITTVAGTNAGSGFSGDGGPANLAMLNNPKGVAVDDFGNFFISDTGNYRVRKVDSNGIITTVAGTNFPPGFSGDGGVATNAQLHSPEGIIVDHLGNLYIADNYNGRIRRVDTNGIITTVAGTNTSGFSGDGGPANLAKLQYPQGVTVDGLGNLFIADLGNNRIRKVDTNGIIMTVAGTNIGGFYRDGSSAVTAELNQPSQAILDAFGNLFIADTYNNRIRKVDANGIISTVVGTNLSGFSGDGGPAAIAHLSGPVGLTLDGYGNLLIADTGNNRVRKVDLAGSPILQLNKLTTNSVGNYQVVITSPSGSVTSSIASLTVYYITTQPTNARAVAGSSAGFYVAVSGDAPFSYQWFTSSGRTATAWPIVVGSIVYSVIVSDPGAGYVSTPQVHFVGGSGSGAIATAYLQSGSVYSINVNSPGSGYASVPPTVLIDPPPTSNTLLPNQTNALLTLPAVTSADATNYFVVVTNNYGSVTSATVFLTVFLPPQNFSAQYLGTALQMQLSGTPNYPYVLQTTTNLTPPISWTSIRTNAADASGNWQYTDSNLNYLQRFYRAMGQ